MTENNVSCSHHIFDITFVKNSTYRFFKAHFILLFTFDFSCISLTHAKHFEMPQCLKGAIEIKLSYRVRTEDYISHVTSLKSLIMKLILQQCTDDLMISNKERQEVINDTSPTIESIGKMWNVLE